MTILDVLGILRGVTTDSYGERGGVWWGGESQRVACIEFDREILAWRPTKRRISTLFSNGVQHGPGNQLAH